jgi:hypothetical protein
MPTEALDGRAPADGRLPWAVPVVVAYGSMTHVTENVGRNALPDGGKGGTSRSA